MFDISNLSAEELIVYEADYMIRKTCEDIEDFYCDLELEDRVQLASALHRIVLQFNPSY